uniref:Uncharacterized protein n=1 Tax=Anopheles farauti TaxID=69004 RepID=A0A182QF45_9DIPT
MTDHCHTGTGRRVVIARSESGTTEQCTRLGMGLMVRVRLVLMLHQIQIVQIVQLRVEKGAIEIAWQQRVQIIHQTVAQLERIGRRGNVATSVECIVLRTLLLRLLLRLLLLLLLLWSHSAATTRKFTNSGLDMATLLLPPITDDGDTAAVPVVPAATTRFSLATAV